MGVIFFVAILFLIGAGCIFAGIATRNMWYYAGTAGTIVVAGFILIVSSLTTIGPSDVGIVTAFGHTVGSDLGPGIHWVPPWDSVTVWDDSVQRTAFEGKDCLEIRIANQQAACLDVIVFWKDKASASDQQFKQYRTFPRVEAAYFSRGVVTKFFNNVFETYDPVALASVTTRASTQGGVTVSSLTANVLRNMQGAYADIADVTSLNSGQVRYNPQVEAALSKVVTAQAATNVALQSEKTALAQAAAARSLNSGNNLSQLVVEQNCLTMTQTLEQAGNTLSPAWNCIPGGSGVIVSATGK